MVPWLQNVELVEDAHLSHPHVINQSDYPIDELDVGESYQNPVLKGNGWGSIEGTKVVLHNLLYITAKVNFNISYVKVRGWVRHLYVKVRGLG